MHSARVIRLFPDATAPWPLWETGTAKYMMEPTDYDLSAELTNMLKEWQDFWDRHHSFNRDVSWDSEANRLAWLQQGRQVEAVLRREVADIADVRAEYQ